VIAPASQAESEFHGCQPHDGLNQGMVTGDQGRGSCSIPARTSAFPLPVIAEGRWNDGFCFFINVLEELYEIQLELKQKIRFLLLPKSESTIIGSKPGRQLPPKRD
jgi:hypothetical protein